MVQEARAAAEDLRPGGRPVLPKGDAMFLDRRTARLLEALVELEILRPGDVPGIGTGLPAERPALRSVA